MSTQSFDLPPTGNPLVDRALQRLSARTDERFQSLKTLFMFKRRLKVAWLSLLSQQAQLLGSHSKLHSEPIDAVHRHEKWLKDCEIKKVEMDEKINSLMDRDMRREGGPESKGSLVA